MLSLSKHPCRRSKISCSCGRDASAVAGKTAFLATVTFAQLLKVDKRATIFHQPMAGNRLTGNTFYIIDKQRYKPMLRSLLLARVCDALPTGFEPEALGRKTCGRARQRHLTRAAGSDPGGNASQTRVGASVRRCVTSVMK